MLEQHCSSANEIDADDAKSWHWVAFDDSSGRGNDDDDDDDRERAHPEVWRDEVGYAVNVRPSAVGTIRLVPVGAAVERFNDAAPGTGPSHGPTQLWDGREPYIKLGRLATLFAHRGLGLGRLLVGAALEWATDHAIVLHRQGLNPCKSEIQQQEDGEVDAPWKGLVLVHAQKVVEGFWRGLGFETDEGMGRWWEEGIEHLGMWRRLEIR